MYKVVCVYTANYLKYPTFTIYNADNADNDDTVTVTIDALRKYIKDGLIDLDSISNIQNIFNFELPKSNKNKKRSSWDQYFMEKAIHASTRSTCNRLHVGAVLVRGKRDIITGYNGSMPGEPHCTDVGCLMVKGSCKRTIHAEMNVIDYCARVGIPTKGTTLFVTHYPCANCMQHIVNAGIAEVVYKEFYAHKFDNNFSSKLHLRLFTPNGSDSNPENVTVIINPTTIGSN